MKHGADNRDYSAGAAQASVRQEVVLNYSVILQPVDILNIFCKSQSRHNPLTHTWNDCRGRS